MAQSPQRTPGAISISAWTTGHGRGIRSKGGPRANKLNCGRVRVVTSLEIRKGRRKVTVDLKKNFERLFPKRRSANEDQSDRVKDDVKCAISWTDEYRNNSALRTLCNTRYIRLGATAYPRWGERMR